MSNIDLQVETFAAEIDLDQLDRQGEVDMRVVDRWSQLKMRDYSPGQLLESVYRHVKGLQSGNQLVLVHHLTQLNMIADEIESRRMQEV